MSRHYHRHHFKGLIWYLLTMVKTYIGIIVSYENSVILQILERVPEQAITAFWIWFTTVNQFLRYLFIFHASQIISARLPYSLQYLGAN